MSSSSSVQSYSLSRQPCECKHHDHLNQTFLNTHSSSTVHIYTRPWQPAVYHRSRVAKRKKNSARETSRSSMTREFVHLPRSLSDGTVLFISKTQSPGRMMNNTNGYWEPNMSKQSGHYVIHGCICVFVCGCVSLCMLSQPTSVLGRLKE